MKIGCRDIHSRHRDRGVSPVVGFILVIGLVVVAWGIYSTTIVPEWNEDAEFEHTKDVKADLVALQEAIRDVSISGNGRPVSMQLGVSYPNPPFTVQVPSRSGQVRTTDAGQLRIVNARAVQPETADFWNGSVQAYQTRGLAYRIDYVRRGTAPTIRYEHSLVVSEYESDAVVESSQSLINGRELTLTTLKGETQESASGVEDIPVRPVTSGYQTVAVRANGSPLRISLPTQLSNATWQEALAGERTSNGGFVTSIDYRTRAGSPNLVNLTLVANETYNLNLGQVGIKRVGGNLSAAYLTTVDRGRETIEANQTTSFVVEARDRYNTPQSGVEVAASVSGNGTVRLSSTQTASDGGVGVRYAAPENVSETFVATVTVSMVGRSGEATMVRENITVQPRDRGDDEFETSNTVRLTADESQDGVSCNAAGEECTVNASKVSAVDLTAELDPAQSGRDATFLSSNFSVGSVGYEYRETNDAGIASGYFHPRENGETVIQSEIAGARDELRINVTNGGLADPIMTDIKAKKIEYFPKNKSDAYWFEIHYSVTDPDDEFNKVEFTVSEGPIPPYDSGFTYNGVTRAEYTNSNISGEFEFDFNDSDSIKPLPQFVKWEVINSSGEAVDSGAIWLTRPPSGDYVLDPGSLSESRRYFLFGEIRYSGDRDRDGVSNLVDDCPDIPNSESTSCTN